MKEGPEKRPNTEEEDKKSAKNLTSFDLDLIESLIELFQSRPSFRRTIKHQDFTANGQGPARRARSEGPGGRNRALRVKARNNELQPALPSSAVSTMSVVSATNGAQKPKKVSPKSHAKVSSATCSWAVKYFYFHFYCTMTCFTVQSRRCYRLLHE